MKEAWGKNQFNSSFPIALCCYLNHSVLKANYLKSDNGIVACKETAIEDAFNAHPFDEDVYYAFESIYLPFQKYTIGSLPRTDVVIQKKSTGECLSAVEIKLTAVPDNTTCELDDEHYGAEIVVRPDTIVYLACNVADSIASSLRSLFSCANINVRDWSEAKNVLPFINRIITLLKNVVIELESYQKPFLLQPIWKTEGKSLVLSDHCLDVFFWSDAAFISFILELASSDFLKNKIGRKTRSIIWLYKMLHQIIETGRFNHRIIIDSLSYNTRNDKAFASSGRVTRKFMESERLRKPIVKKEEIKNIILGGGHNLLSPERRFDAVISNSPEIFS